MMYDTEQVSEEQKINRMVEDVWQMIHSGELKQEKVFEVRGENTSKSPPFRVMLDGREAGADLLMGLHPAVFKAFKTSRRGKKQ